GHHAADQSRTEAAQLPHESQRVQPHLAQVMGAFVAFVEAGEGLGQLADFCVGREGFGLAGATAETFGGFSVCGEVLGLHALVHQAGGFKGDGLANFVMAHPFLRRYWKPISSGAGLVGMICGTPKSRKWAATVSPTGKRGTPHLPVGLRETDYSSRSRMNRLDPEYGINWKPLRQCHSVLASLPREMVLAMSIKS